MGSRRHEHYDAGATNNECEERPQPHSKPKQPEEKRNAALRRGSAARALRRDRRGHTAGPGPGPDRAAFRDTRAAGLGPGGVLGCQGQTVCRPA